MTKNNIINEYEDSGLEIIDFHLGLRYAKDIFNNATFNLTIIVGLILIPYIFKDNKIVAEPFINYFLLFALTFIVMVFVASIFSFTYKYLSIPLIIFEIYSTITKSKFSLLVIDTKFMILFLIYEAIFFISLILAIRAYFVSKKILIKDGFLIIPASDVEQSFLAFILLKPLWGFFYKKKILLSDIIEVRIDGYGNKKEDIYPIIINDLKSSNKLIFTSRQKRDEFRSKITKLLKLNNTKDAFGESESN